VIARGDVNVPDQGLITKIAFHLSPAMELTID
jgi:hypothetical protein